MPATANILAKAAIGICDDLVSGAIVACPAPVVLVPSMNEVMWESTVTQRNVESAKALGYHVIEPGIGVEVSNMQPIVGTMPAPVKILGELMRILLQSRTSKEPGELRVTSLP
jgi:phosphopantothenoylcysteine synthetase/decarboxylase